MDSSPTPQSTRILLLVNHQNYADRLINALSPDGYEFETVLFDQFQNQFNLLLEPAVSILWFPYASPEALSEFEQLVAFVRNLGKPTPLPLLLIIDKYGSDYVEPGFLLGISDILTRPIHPLVLRQRVRLLLQARQTEQAIARFQESERELLLEKERFRTVADFTYDWEYWQDQNRNILYNSPSCKRITGREADEFLVDPELLIKIVHPEDKERVQAHFLEEKNNIHPSTLDFRIFVPDGSERWIGHVCQPVYNQQNQFAGRRVSNRDITDRKNAEFSVIRAERMAAMGHLTASLAHEINNPLQAMYTNIELLSDFPLEKSERQHYLSVVRKETERLIRIVQSILDYVRPKKAHPQLTQLSDVLDTAVKLTQKELILSKIDISLLIPPNLPPLWISPDQLEQVCLNLMINAAEHMQSGGTLTINAQLNGSVMEIQFIDTGEGIQPQDIQLIFEPFYTKKINGTGLGLSVSQKIIQQYGGQLTVSSQPGLGSIFSISLPISEVQ